MYIGINIEWDTNALLCQFYIISSNIRICKLTVGGTS